MSVWSGFVAYREREIARRQGRKVDGLVCTFCRQRFTMAEFGQGVEHVTRHHAEG